MVVKGGAWEESLIGVQVVRRLAIMIGDSHVGLGVLAGVIQIVGELGEMMKMGFRMSCGILQFPGRNQAVCIQRQTR